MARRNNSDQSFQRRAASIDHRNISTRFISLDELCNICQVPPETPSIGVPPDFSLLESSTNSRSNQRAPITTDSLLMPSSTLNSSSSRRWAWPNIGKAMKYLLGEISRRTIHIDHIKTAIESIVEHNCDMDNLTHLLYQVYPRHVQEQFLYRTLPKMCQWVLDIDDIVPKPPRLLRAGYKGSVTMSQTQAAALLSCSFFCLFPHRSTLPMPFEFQNFPLANFLSLYRRGSIKKLAKLQCILNYFQRVAERMPTGVLTIQRLVLESSSRPEWNKSQKKLVPIHITSEKKIEDVPNTLQVDFANAFIGGGVLGEGCLQEEIRFSICPEMLVSLLFCEKLRADECIRFIGCERFSNYTGYGDTFQFNGNYTDERPRDSYGRRWTRIVAIDASHYEREQDQYQVSTVVRELNKAFIGFRREPQGDKDSFPITTGHWGCGAFNGDRQLKALIQLAVASEVNRSLIYAAYGDRAFEHQFTKVYQHLTNIDMRVSDICDILFIYYSKTRAESLFDYILSIKPDKKLP